jgi:hypothetical protein
VAPSHYHVFHEKQNSFSLYCFDLRVVANIIKPLNVAVESQDCYPCALLSSCKIISTGVSNLNVHRYSRKVPDIVVRSETNLDFFSTDFHKGPQYQVSLKSVQWKPL